MPTEFEVYKVFQSQVKERPDAPAIVFGDLSFTYEKLDRLVLSFYHKMKEAGVDHHSTLMVQSSDPLIVIAALLATACLGASSVQDDDEGLALPADLVVTHHFHTVEPDRTPAAGSIRIDEKWSPSQTLQPADLSVPNTTIDTEKPWLYVYTSGTTGLPKFLAWSQRMVCQRSAAVSDDFIGGKTRVASLMPFNSRTFIARALAALLNGATIVDGKDADFWKRAGVTLITGSVGQMAGFFRNKSTAVNFPIAEVIGSRLSKPDTRELLKYFAEVHDVFGASEANKVFTSVSKIASGGTIQTVGKSRDSEVEIVNVDGEPVARGENGILRIRNPYLASGYIGDASASKEAFRDGWFYPGDIASWGDNNTLVVLDRVDNVLNIGGMKINAFVVDQVLKSVDGIKDAISFKSPKKDNSDELFAFVVFDEGQNQFQVMEIARKQCENKLGLAFVPRVIRGVSGIPRHSNGQPNRKACADLITELGRSRRDGPIAS